MSGIKEISAKDQPSGDTDDGAQETEYIVAVGLPKGLIHQEDGDEPTGVIRIARRIVDSLTPTGYGVWAQCLSPVVAGSNAAQGISSALGRYPRVCQSVMDELFAAGYLARLQLGSRLGREISDLRPIPSGYGEGNSSFDIGKYRVDSKRGVGSVTLDVIGQALWSLMDGSLTLGEIAAEATEWLEIAPELVEMGLIYTVVELMKGRCLYIDRGVSL